MNVLDELDEVVRRSHPIGVALAAKAVRRMKRDRLTIRKMEQRLRWYDGKVNAMANELRRRAAEKDSRG